MTDRPESHTHARTSEPPPPAPAAGTPAEPGVPTERVAPACPQCGGPALRIVYGLVGPEAFGEMARNRQVPGGCVIMPDSPDWVCEECRHKWDTPRMPWWGDWSR